mgnify:CR=1 FL=1
MDRRNLRLTIEYDGTAYGGWQVQENAPTVQGTIEAAIQAPATTARRWLRRAGRCCVAPS